MHIKNLKHRGFPLTLRCFWQDADRADGTRIFWYAVRDGFWLSVLADRSLSIGFDPQLSVGCRWLPNPLSLNIPDWLWHEKNKSAPHPICHRHKESAMPDIHNLTSRSSDCSQQQLRLDTHHEGNLNEYRLNKTSVPPWLCVKLLYQKLLIFVPQRWNFVGV